MARQVNQALWDQWRQRLARQHESGLSIVEFCRQEDLSSHGFHVWKRKLGKAAAAARPARQRQTVAVGSRSPRQRTSSAFPRPMDFLQLPVAATRSSPWTELVLADGTVIRLPQQNIAALLAVLRVLRGESVAPMLTERRDA